ncbi:MAG: hypothetical protein Q4P31_07215, partial [Andreesenia angusta]|nr:hypothetical protein [Andreesenia angusta]
MQNWKKRLNLFLAFLLLFTSINFGAIITFSEQAYSESEITREHSKYLDIPDKVFRALILRDILDKFEEYDDDHYVLSEDLGEIETTEELTVPEFLLDVDIDESVSYIENLNGIGYFKSLNTLTIEDIDIDSLDLSKNANLKTLNIEGTNLENLNLSKNANLENLKIENTKLKNLDLSNTDKLKSFDGYSTFTVKSDVVKDKYRLYLDSILTETELENYKKFNFKTINSKNESVPTNIKKTNKDDKLYAELDVKNKDRLEFSRDTGNPNFPLTIQVIPIKSSETIFEDEEDPEDEKIAKEISFHRDPNKKDYSVGEKIDTKGLIAKIQYDDKSEEFISVDKFDEYRINLNLIRNNKLISIDSPLEANDKNIQLSINVKEDQILTAISECLNVLPIYNVNFNITDKGTVSKSDKKYLENKIREGHTIENIPIVIPNSGYEFKGWITDNSSTLLTSDEIKTLSVDDDLKITAVYSNVSGKLLAEFKDEEFRNRLTKELKKKGRAPIPNIKLPEGYKYPIYTTDLPVLESLNKLSISGPYSQWSNDKPVHSIEGIELLKSLEEINLTRNKLEELDLSKNTSLKKIHARDNSIETLKLPKAVESKLEELDISNNEIEELDLKDQKFLHWIEATSNKLNHVDTRGLMRVDRANFYNNELSELDFIDMRTLTELTIGKNNFKKIDIRPAINLKKLIIDENNLVDLIASGHDNISIIHAENNQIRELKLNGVNSLTQLYLDNNPLELYDANQNPQLTNLGLKNTSLIELDLSKSNNLRSVDISNTNDKGNNRIKELDFSNCPKLYKAELNNNYLSKLDFSNNPELMYLYAKNNMLKEIKLSDNGLSEVDLSNNNLIKIESKLKNLASSKVTLNPQSRTVRAKKVDGRYSINLKEFLGESYNWLTNYYKGGELNKETGELKVFEYRDSFEYTIGCGGKDEFPMTVKLIFTDDDIIESMVYVKPFDTEYALDGKVVNLPKDIEVIMNTGEFKRLPIEWEENSVKVDKDNSPITVSGNISGSNYPVIYEIKVIVLPELPDINVSQYESVNLPNNIKIPDLGNADILWEEENINTNDIGVQVINGKIDGIGEITQKIIVKEFKEDYDTFLLNIPNEVLRREISQKISFGRDPIPNNVKVPRDYKYPLYSTDLPKIKKITNLKIEGTNPNTVNFRENPKLTSLKGIEFLEELSSLTLEKSDIKTIDLSNNKKLRSFVSKYNNTETLILGELPNLETLLIGGNKIKDLNLSGTKALTRVEAPNCNIESINITNLDKLNRLWI